MVDEPLFKNSDGALHFAFKFSCDQYDRPAMSKMATKPGPTGKGLGGLDGAAQAGMILSEVQQLGGYHAAILCGRFGVRQVPCQCRASCCSGTKFNPEWGRAVGCIADVLAKSVLSGCSSEPLLWRAIISKYFGGSWQFTDMVNAFKVTRDMATDHNSKIVEALRREEVKAKRAIDERLSKVGIVGSN